MSDEHQEYDAASKPRGSRTCLVMSCILGMVVLAVVVTITNFVASRPPAISEETTILTEPLKSDGEQVDYFLAVEEATYPEGMATEKNGYRLIVKHLGPSPEMDEYWQVKQLYEKLGLDSVADAPDLTYVDPWSFAREYVAREEFDPSEVDHLRSEPIVEEEETAEGEEDYPDEFTGEEIGEDYGIEEYDAYGYAEEDPGDLIERRYGSPWTLDDLPMMEEWLEKNGPALDVVAEAVRKPVFKIPYTRENEDSMLLDVLLPDVQNVRQFARGLECRANHRIATGDIDGAIDDIITCKRLGRHVGRGGFTVIELLVGIALEGIGNSIGVAGSPEHPPTKAHIERLLDETDSLPPRATIVEVLERERFWGLDAIQAWADGRVSFSYFTYSGSGPDQVVPWIGLDWNIVMTRFNEHYDAMLATDVYPPEPSFSPALLFSRDSRSELMANVIANLVLPASGAAREAERRTQCCDRMQRITLAMLLYELDHGTPPPAYSIDEDGRPLHSWRVLLLPYLGEEAKELYDKIHLDEPWDSEHNATLHATAVPFYQCPSTACSGTIKQGETTYSVVVGPETPFEDGEGKRLADFGPDSDDMILLVETPDAFCWMDPTREITQADAEMGINAGVTSRGVGSPHPGGGNFGLRDGSVHFLSEAIAPDLFKDLLRGVNKEIDY